MEDFAGTCPIPIEDYPTVLLAHGGGGRLTHHLLEKMFLPAFDNELLDARNAYVNALVDYEMQRLGLMRNAGALDVSPDGDVGQLV